MNDEQRDSLRADKWLWHARVLETRTAAARLIEEGKVRLNRERISKASQTVRPGDVLTVTLRGQVRVLEVTAIGTRRGPAAEARELYIDHTVVEAVSSAGEGLDQGSRGSNLAQAVREPGAGRPTKRERREIERLRKSS